MPRQGSHGHLGITAGGVRAALSGLGGSGQSWLMQTLWWCWSVTQSVWGFWEVSLHLAGVEADHPNCSTVSGWAKETVRAGSCPSQDF